MRVVPVNDNTSPATLRQSILPLLQPFCDAMIRTVRTTFQKFWLCISSIRTTMQFVEYLKRKRELSLACVDISID